VVLSIAAIAGCGQAADPQAAPERSSDTRGTARDGAARPSGSVDDQQGSDDTAALDDSRRRSATEPSEPGDDGRLTGGGARGDDTQRHAASEVTSARAPGAENPEEASSAPPHAADTGEHTADVDDDIAADGLDTLEHTVVAMLGSARQGAGAPRLQIDATLVDDARDRACEMAQGTTPLVSEDDTENIGLVVEPEPGTAARTMHDWWMETPRSRDVRLTEAFTRYGVGACTAGERVYYAERFGL